MLPLARTLRVSALALGFGVLLLGLGSCASAARDCTSTDNGDHNVPLTWTTPTPLAPLYVSKTGGYTHQGAQITFYSKDLTVTVAVPDPPGGPNPYPHPIPGTYQWNSGSLDTSLADCTEVGYKITLTNKEGQTRILTGRIIINH